MQELHLITDTTCFEAINIPRKVNSILSIGACIIRVPNNSDPNNCYTECINRKLIYIYNARSSAHAELIIGIKALRCLVQEFAGKYKIIWVCDLPYLPALLKAHAESPPEPKGPLFEELETINSLIEDIAIDVRTPKTSQMKHYHALCHRACSMLRPTVIGAFDSTAKKTLDSESFFQEIEVLVYSFLNRRNSNWKLKTTS